MKKIASNGKSFHQGWNDTLASQDEKRECRVLSPMITGSTPPNYPEEIL